jgi:hypothetical protein
VDDKFKQGEKAAEKLTNQAEKELIKAYRESLKEIRAQLALAYEKYAADGTLTMAEMMKYGRLVKLDDITARFHQLTHFCLILIVILRLGYVCLSISQRRKVNISEEYVTCPGISMFLRVNILHLTLNQISTTATLQCASR